MSGQSVDLTTKIKRVEARAVIAFAGDKLEVSADAALPPGSRVELVVPLSLGQVIEVQGKVIATRKGPGGTHLVAVRLHTLSAVSRQALAAAAQGLEKATPR